MDPPLPNQSGAHFEVSSELPLNSSSKTSLQVPPGPSGIGVSDELALAAPAAAVVGLVGALGGEDEPPAGVEVVAGCVERLDAAPARSTASSASVPSWPPPFSTSRPT